MSKARDLANYISAGTVDSTELGYLDGVTSNIQTQIDNISVTSGSLTKTFANGETASITLSGALSPAPVVSVTKEVAQTGVSSKGGWDVATDGANYELHDTAYAVTLTPSSASSNGTFTLGSGSFASTDVGKRIVGNGGEAILTATDGSYSVVTAFNDSSTIASGSWSMYALTFDGTDGVTLSGLLNSFDLANASFDNVTFSVNGQQTFPFGIVFSSDGTNMYITGIGTDAVHQYTLTTAFDISTASYASKSLSIASQETGAEGLAISNDGTKLYVCGRTIAVYQYTMSTAFDLSTASYGSVSFSTASQDAGPTGLVFNNDGTKMYIVGNGGDSVYQYTLSTAFDLSTASYDSVSFSVTSEATDPRDVSFNNNGTKMYILDITTDAIFQYSLSTAFDLSTASYDSVSFSVVSEENSVGGMTFNNDGTKMYIVGSSGDDVNQYSTGSIFTPTSAYHPTVTKASGQIDTAFWTDINTMTADETLNGGEVYYAVSTDDRTTWAVIDDTDGVRNIVRDNAGTWQYNDATTYSGTTWVNATTNDELYALQEALEDGNAVETIGFNLANASYDSVSFSVTSQETEPREVLFNTDGTKMFVIGYTGDDVNEYTLSPAYDISTASFVDSFSISSQEGTPQSFAFNSDGTKMYIVGQTNDTVYQYTLSTGFDVSTASYDSVSLSVASQETTPKGLTFSSDGTKMYIVGSTNDTVYQYTLTTAYDLSTASYSSISFSVASQATGPEGIAFNSDGTKMFILGSNTQAAYQYTLSTAYNVSTASYDSVTLSISSQDTQPSGITFNASGTKMFLVGSQNDSVYQFSTTITGNFNRMNSTQLDAVTDPNHYTLGDTLDLGIILYTASAGSIPESDGVTINYDAEALNQGAVVGTDYDFDFPDSTTVRVTSNAAQNLKIRVV